MDSCPYNFSSLSAISPLKWPPLQPRAAIAPNFSVFSGGRSCRISCTMRTYAAEPTSNFSYKKFVDFALEETQKHAELNRSPLQENFNCFTAIDGKTELQMHSFESAKIRLLRSLYVEGSDGMQVLDFAIFPRQEFDLPIFCANFFSTTATNIVVLDLNPLYDVIREQNYKEKYYKDLIQLAVKYTELFPWGGKLTAESMTFFSPMVIWTRFSPSQQKHDELYSAFKDYLKSWLDLMDQASPETDISQIALNLELQHRYLAWRAEKDPGRHLLEKLVGQTRAKVTVMQWPSICISQMIKNSVLVLVLFLCFSFTSGTFMLVTLLQEIVRTFLFNGVEGLGGKTFIDYFPEYRTENGTVNQKRSMIGKSFEQRPWDTRGEFVGNIL